MTGGWCAAPVKESGRLRTMTVTARRLGVTGRWLTISGGGVSGVARPRAGVRFRAVRKVRRFCVSRIILMRSVQRRQLTVRIARVSCLCYNGRIVTSKYLSFL